MERRLAHETRRYRAPIWTSWRYLSESTTYYFRTATRQSTTSDISGRWGRWLIRGWPLNVVDYDHIHERPPRFDLEAKLLLQCRENRLTLRIGRWDGVRRFPEKRERSLVRSPLQ